MKQARKTLSSDRTFGPGPGRETTWGVIVRTNETGGIRYLEGTGATAIQAARSVGYTLGETVRTMARPVPELPAPAIPEDRFAQLYGPDSVEWEEDAPHSDVQSSNGSGKV